jgi:hypothetical protein
MYRPPIIQIKQWNNTITSLSLSLLPFSRLGMAAALEDNDISLSLSKLPDYNGGNTRIKDGIDLSERSTKNTRIILK